jgi:hypothetical protein
LAFSFISYLCTYDQHLHSYMFKSMCISVFITENMHVLFYWNIQWDLVNVHMAFKLCSVTWQNLTEGSGLWGLKYSVLYMIPLFLFRSLSLGSRGMMGIRIFSQRAHNPLPLTVGLLRWMTNYYWDINIRYIIAFTQSILFQTFSLF